MTRPESAATPTLRRRLIVSLSAFALLLTALFSGFVLLVAYVVEDGYLAAALQLEAERQTQAWQEQRQWLSPMDARTRIVADPAEFPDDLRPAFEQRPSGREFAGEAGRHYHLRALRGDWGEVWLVAEVGDRLLFRQMRGGVLAWLAAGSALMLCCALALGYWMAGRISAPLAQLADAVGNTDPNTSQTALAHPPHGQLAEVDALSGAFDALLLRVQQAMQRERAFSQDASHELRTPLAVIISSAEQARRSAPDSDAIQALDRVLQTARQLQQSLQVLLALNREAEPLAGQCALLPVLERVIVEQSVWHDDAALRLDIDVPANAGMAVPEQALHLILSNLLGNALAHAEADAGGGRPVSIAASGNPCRLCIRNRSKQALGESDLQPFAKGADSAGLGLGLNIVQRLATKHGLALRFSHDAGWLEVTLQPV